MVMVLAVDWAVDWAADLGAVWAAAMERAAAAAVTAPHQNPAAPIKLLKLPHR